MKKNIYKNTLILSVSVIALSTIHISVVHAGSSPTCTVNQRYCDDGNGNRVPTSVCNDPRSGAYQTVSLPPGKYNGNCPASWGCSSSGKILCGHYFNRGILSYELYIGDLEFAQNVSQQTKLGYWFWAVPLTKYLNNNPNGLVEKIVQPFVLGWATEMAYRTGYSNKGNLLGLFLLKAISPIASFIGKFVKEKDWHSVNTELLTSDDIYFKQQAIKTVNSYNNYILEISA